LGHSAARPTRRRIGRTKNKIDLSEACEKEGFESARNDTD
jgi:hypothetical protein